MVSILEIRNKMKTFSEILKEEVDEHNSKAHHYYYILFKKYEIKVITNAVDEYVKQLEKHGENS
jgi:hypothetical protein